MTEQTTIETFEIDADEDTLLAEMRARAVALATASGMTDAHIVAESLPNTRFGHRSLRVEVRGHRTTCSTAASLIHS